jgi:hypothetical protein
LYTYIYVFIHVRDICTLHSQYVYSIRNTYMYFVQNMYILFKLRIYHALYVYFIHNMQLCLLSTAMTKSTCQAPVIRYRQEIKSEQSLLHD